MATSYLIFHRYQADVRTMTFADRNLSNGQVTGCATFGTAWSIDVPFYGRQTTRWGTNLHQQAGNVARADGQVDQITDRELLDLTYFPYNDNATFHFIAR